MKTTPLAHIGLIVLSLVHAQSSRFTDNGSPYIGNAEFQATLWSVPTGGTALASNSPVGVAVSLANGVFVLSLDFGNHFPGEDRWLQSEVRTTFGASTTLMPRQQLMPTPITTTASNLSGAVADGQLSASVSLLGASIESAEIANGTIVPADVNVASFSNTFWRVSGNLGANPTNGAFLGPTENLPLEIKVNGLRTLADSASNEHLF